MIIHQYIRSLGYSQRSEKVAGKLIMVFRRNILWFFYSNKSLYGQYLLLLTYKIGRFIVFFLWWIAPFPLILSGFHTKDEYVLLCSFSSAKIYSYHMHMSVIVSSMFSISFHFLILIFNVKWLEKTFYLFFLYTIKNISINLHSPSKSIATMSCLFLSKSVCAVMR